MKLSGSLIASLYPHSLVEEEGTAGPNIDAKQKKQEETTTATPAEEPSTQAARDWKWLGENGKQVLIVVRYRDVVHLPDQALKFLTGILTACKLSLADVAILNIEQQPSTQYRDYLDTFQSRVALLFDVDPAGFGLPMNFPFYQIQPFAQCSFLHAPTLEELESDKVQKSKLWVALRRLFNI